MLIKKTIVLSDDSRKVGHLTLIRVGQDTGAKLALVRALEGRLIIKFSSKEEEFFKVEKVREEYTLNSTLESQDLIGVLVLDEGGKVIAKGGNYELIREERKTKSEVVEELSPDNGETVVEESVSEKHEESIPNIEDEIPKPMESESIIENDNEEEKDGVTSEKESAFRFIKGENFYKNVRGKLTEIMTANPTEKNLERLIPDSKWVKVYYEKGEYYVVGILTEDGEVKFLAYGVPGVKSVLPPKDAEELCDFLELDGVPGEGYWMMFQDAKNGEIVKSIE